MKPGYASLTKFITSSKPLWLKGNVWVQSFSHYKCFFRAQSLFSNFMNAKFVRPWLQQKLFYCFPFGDLFCCCWSITGTCTMVKLTNEISIEICLFFTRDDNRLQHFKLQSQSEPKPFFPFLQTFFTSIKTQDTKELNERKWSKLKSQKLKYLVFV